MKSVSSDPSAVSLVAPSTACWNSAHSCSARASLRFEHLALFGAGGFALAEHRVAREPEFLPQLLIDAARHDADVAPPLLQRLDLVDRRARVAARRLNRLRFVDDGLLRLGVAIPLGFQFGVQARRECVELHFELAARRAVHRMELAPLLARRVQDAFRRAPIGVIPLHPVEITFEIGADLAALFEIELARCRLCIEMFATRSERDFGGVVETVEQPPVVVIRHRSEIFPACRRSRMRSACSVGSSGSCSELFHLGEELLALRVRRERAPVFQFLHAYRQRHEVALHALCRTGRKTVQQALAFAFEARGAREIAGVDLCLELADDVVQSVHQLLVQRMTRSVVFASVACAVDRRRATAADAAGPRASRPARACAPDVLRPGARGVVRTTAPRILRATRRSGPAGTAASASVSSSACAPTRSAASYKQREAVRNRVKARRQLFRRRTVIGFGQPTILIRAAVDVNRFDRCVAVALAAADCVEQRFERSERALERGFVAGRLRCASGCVR